MRGNEFLRLSSHRAATPPVIEERPGRYEPRVRKRRPKQYPLMKRPRADLKKELLSNRVAA